MIREIDKPKSVANENCPKGKKVCEISDSQANLSRIRFRIPLCSDCYIEKRDK